jgi:hypothetical protein
MLDPGLPYWLETVLGFLWVAFLIGCLLSVHFRR